MCFHSHRRPRDWEIAIEAILIITLGITLATLIILMHILHYVDPH